MQRVKFDAIALTVDTITGGNRERDLNTVSLHLQTYVV